MTMEALSSSPKCVSSLFLKRGDKDDSICSLDHFLKELPSALQKRKIEAINPGASNDPVSILLGRTQLSENEWKDYAMFDETQAYTRNLIATDNETYTLLLLCWNPGKESPIHDHPCDGCWLKVFRGSVQECRYDSNLQCVSDETFHEGQLGYIYDSMGYHKVGNPSKFEGAITLHLYAPPILRCRVWRSEDPKSEEISKSINFSEFGKIVTT
jgi:cysteine dioxygenase